MASHQNQFYAYIEHASIHSTIGHKLVFSVAESPANLRKIGSQNHHIQQVIVPVLMRTLTNITAQVGNFTAYATITQGKDAYQAFDASDVRTLTETPLRFLGATCSSLNGENPCDVIGAVSNNKWEDKILYMVNSNKKFVYNTDTDQDGVANYPTLSDGTIT